MSIEERAEEYVKKNAYLQGARDVLNELELTISVSEDGWLENNLKMLIRELKNG